jgi:hypothetical protein
MSKRLALQAGILYLTQKAEERYLVLLAALGAYERAALGVLAADDAVGVLYELAAVALDLFDCHVKAVIRAGILFCALGI